MFKVNNKEAKTTPMASFWCLYCQLRTYFTLCSNVSIVNFEYINADWVNPNHEPCFKIYMCKIIFKIIHAGNKNFKEFDPVEI